MKDIMFGPSIIGTLADGSGEVITPSRDVFQIEPFKSRRWLEFAQLQHFKRSVLKTQPNYAWSFLGDGADPPDFKICRGDAVIGLEVTAFTSERRRAQVNFFAGLQEKFLNHFRNGLLRKLSGLQIELSFGELGGQPHAIDDQSIADLVNAFENMKRPAMHQDMTAAWNWPEGRVKKVDWRLTSVGNFAMSSSIFAHETGFELSYFYSDSAKPEEIIENLMLRIAAKDKIGNDELLISAGSPNVEGWMLPADAIAAEFAIKYWKGLPKPPVHLKRIFLDLWGPERVYVLYDCDAIKE